jgi:uncharacterized membrane protein YjjB (DUF3815 family)
VACLLGLRTTTPPKHKTTTALLIIIPSLIAFRTVSNLAHIIRSLPPKAKQKKKKNSCN